jgi:hypothetical protein
MGKWRGLLKIKVFANLIFVGKCLFLRQTALKTSVFKAVLGEIGRMTADVFKAVEF